MFDGFVLFHPFAALKPFMPLMTFVQFMQRMALTALASEAGSRSAEKHGECCAKGTGCTRARRLSAGLFRLALDRLFTRLLGCSLRFLGFFLCLSLYLLLRLTQLLLNCWRQLAHRARALGYNDNPRES